MRGSELLDQKDMKKFKISNLVWDMVEGSIPAYFNECVIDVSRADLIECPTEDAFVKLLSDILTETFGFAAKSFTYEQL